MTRTLTFLAVMVFALGMAAMPAGCTDERADWSQARITADTFLGHMQQGRYSDAYKMFDRSSDWKQGKTEADFLRVCREGEAAGLLNFTYTLTQFKANPGARQYSFDVDRQWTKEPQLGASQSGDLEDVALSPRGLIILVERNGEWFVQSYKVKRDYNFTAGDRKLK